jgi:hypothetical protein
MQVGDTVRNILEVRTNPVVNESRGWSPIPAGHLGIVMKVKQTNLNARHSAGGKVTLMGDVYVDVLLAVDGEPVRCGNYHSGTFEVVNG